MMPVVPSQCGSSAGFPGLNDVPRPSWTRPVTPVYSLPFQLPTSSAVINLLFWMLTVPPLATERLLTLLTPAADEPSNGSACAVTSTDPAATLSVPLVRTLFTASLPVPVLLTF